jgi:RND superfamily putative drug exporter
VLIRREPALIAAACVLLLGAGALGTLDARGNLSFTEAFRTSPDSVAGAELIQQAFGAGRVAPLDIVARSDVALRVQDALIATPEVETVIADARSDDGQLIALQGFLKLDPLGQPAIDAIPQLRRVAGDGSGVRARVANAVARTFRRPRCLAVARAVPWPARAQRR